MELILTSLTANWPDPIPTQGTVGKPYSYTLTASGGTPPYSFTITSGSLPAGLILNTGVISGTPTVVAASQAVTFSVTDSQQGTVMNPTKATWIEPTNPDGTAIASGEITGYTLGIRPSSGTAGTYPTTVPVTGATTLTVALPALVSGSYMASVQAIGPNISAWSAEVPFTISEVPNAPTGLTVS